MDYKKIIKSQQLRFKVLRLLKWVPDNVMLRMQYRIKMGFWPNFKHPQRFTEKLQLYKMRYRNPVMHQCVDKYEVRKYVKSKGLGHILNELYGLYDKPEDIDFDKLPEKFVLKTTDGGGGLNVILVRNRSVCNREDIVKKLKLWNGNKQGDTSFGREWAYTGIRHSRIIAEELLEDDNNDDGSVEDYKLMCFNGRFCYLWVDKNRYSDHHRGFWDKDLTFLPNVLSDHDTFAVPPALPDNIGEMVSIAEKLSEDFPYTRIDLYNIKGRIIFGEITFYPWSGYVKFTPDNFDFELGKWFVGY